MSKDQPQHAETMQRFSDQRADFARQIVEMGEAYGDGVDERGSVGATLHRGWLKMKDAVTGDDAPAVLGAASTGEDHDVSEYEKALGDGSFRTWAASVVSLGLTRCGDDLRCGIRVGLPPFPSGHDRTGRVDYRGASKDDVIDLSHVRHRLRRP